MPPPINLRHTLVVLRFPVEDEVTRNVVERGHFGGGSGAPCPSYEYLLMLKPQAGCCIPH